MIIGGGITGSGIARDAAGRGLRVALFEAGDIAQGTSSRSSRLAHGGLRYLETFEFPLVFEALRERGRLLELAPHLVRPLSFLFPVFRGADTGILKLTAGMWAYELLSMFRSPQRHRMLGRSGALTEEPNLRSDKLVGGAVYYDAQVDDARLTLAIARAAADAGASIFPRCAVEDIRITDGKMATVTARDAISGETREIEARLVLNAAGPWSDRVRKLADPAIVERLRPTKGVHIVVDRRRIGNRNAIIFQSVVDDRVMFVLPWRDYAYIGTTDTEYHGDPDEVAADPEDIDYLLRSANDIFPGARLKPSDVVSAWAGVRPLLAPESAEGVSESATSREHEIWRDQSGLLNIAGGKLTTYRSMAAEATDAACEHLERDFGVRSGEYFTEYLPLPGADGSEQEQLSRFGRQLSEMGLAETLLHPMWRRYGSEMEDVLELVASDAAYAERIVADRPYLHGEVIWAVRHEMALDLEDVLRRRLQIFYDEEDGGVGVAGAVAAWMAAEDELGWDQAEIDRQVARYVAAVEATRPD